MPRFLADIPDDDLSWLDKTAGEQGRSRAAVLREAVSTYRAQSGGAAGKGWLDQAFGVWKDRADVSDPVDWQRRERAAWTRPWDDDYEAVRAEFPDLFDEHDDLERQRHLAMTRGSADWKSTGE